MSDTLLIQEHIEGGIRVYQLESRSKLKFVSAQNDCSGSEHWSKWSSWDHECLATWWAGLLCDVVNGSCKPVMWDGEKFPTVAEARTLLEGKE